ncbi:hypothetical protein P7K49_033723 [Saguinus oedipus]|uniref:Uncharacterized protein n=1 Tax=Saguinus oedipus TaxID=9490 RepID=A0ABQ9TT47_SAGOE|nr:hypothetical protein P7K49_033723 [Saguinus oedipus]
MRGSTCSRLKREDPSTFRLASKWRFPQAAWDAAWRTKSGLGKGLPAGLGNPGQPEDVGTAGRTEGAPQRGCSSARHPGPGGVSQRPPDLPELDPSAPRSPDPASNSLPRPWPRCCHSSVSVSPPLTWRGPEVRRLQPPRPVPEAPEGLAAGLVCSRTQEENPGAHALPQGLGPLHQSDPRDHLGRGAGLIHFLTRLSRGYATSTEEPTAIALGLERMSVHPGQPSPALEDWEGESAFLESPLCCEFVAGTWAAGSCEEGAHTGRRAQGRPGPGHDSP